MFEVVRFVNELMSSNCFVIHDHETNGCIVVDPGSEKCEDVIGFIEARKLVPEFIVLTHEHTDHTWGCNTLIDRYDVKVLCSTACKKALPEAGDAYFRYYYDDFEYTYSVKRVDILVEDIECYLKWNTNSIHFFITPGHSEGSMCFAIQGNLFTGDTIMQYKPLVSKSAREIYKDSVHQILSIFDQDKTVVFPGHGDVFRLKDWNYFKM